MPVKIPHGNPAPEGENILFFGYWLPEQIVEGEPVLAESPVKI
jgi:hypothetical protein